MSWERNIKIRSPGPNAEKWDIRRKTSLGTTQLSRYYPGLITSKAEGVYIIDVDGNRYLDFKSQRVNVGHGHPRIAEAVKQQVMEAGLDVGELPKIILAEKLKELAPGALSKGNVLFERAGTLAVERTIMMIRAYSNRSTLFAFQGSYHGGALASMSITLTRSSYRKGVSPMTPDVAYAPFAYCYRCVFGQEYPDCGLLCAENIQYVLDTVAPPEDVAALFMEPVQVTGGVIIPPDEYLVKLRKICDEHQILLVDDEVITGFGRTGKFFSIEHSGITPDIIILAKSIANGLNLSAVIGKNEILEARPYSFGNPVSCAAAIENINIILEEKLEKNASEVGEYFIQRLNEIKEGHEIIGDVRGRGLLIGLELVSDIRKKKPATKKTKEIVIEAYRNGLLMLIGGTYRNVLRLTPALNISINEVDDALQILEKTLKKMEE
jgi:4-aminobutyrate aminotransferase-like enzyme